MTLVWSAPGLRPCNYLKTMELKGEAAGRFRTTDHAVVLTFDSPIRSHDCESTPIAIADQKFAIKHSEYVKLLSFRAKRELVTTEQLASEVTGEDLHRQEQLRRLLTAICPLLPEIPDATILARKLLRTNDAKWRSQNGEHRHYWKHTVVLRFPSKYIKLRRSVNCTLYLPVWVTLPHVGQIEAFLDTVNRVLSQSSPVADCKLHRTHYLEVTDGFIKFDLDTGTTT